eukprot:TRINITY_DN105311_c0_g1_i1.p1 TRINITY_DN105311_c0_g1~~TRINITY_DN105311_c0_g1_i1.p1  ORF type:complete len:550 (+),score=110.43 TRINITY_DN105311_c0_g1_i1:129-1778(+)
MILLVTPGSFCRQAAFLVITSCFLIDVSGERPENTDESNLDVDVQVAGNRTYSLQELTAATVTLLRANASAERSSLHAANSAVQSVQVGVGMAGLGALGDGLKILAVCAICAVGYKMLSSLCASRKCDCRRFKFIAKVLLEWGWDEFEGFDVIAMVHGVSDIQNDGWIGKKEFKVKLGWNWSNTETAGTKDLRWEQARKLEIPQGAAEGRIQLVSLGTLKDSVVGTYSLDTKKDMIDKGDSFFGKKQKFKLELKGRTVGMLSMTFKKKGSGAGELGGCPVEGIDEDSALYFDVMNAVEDMVKKKEILPLAPNAKLTGEKKVFVLSKVLEGALRKIDLETSKENGTVYVRVIQCNFSELKGEDQKEEWKKQLEKAAKKGLSQPERKWYVALYENKNAALDAKKWHYPDVFFPLMCITSVHRSPERQDQFLIKYTAGSKETLCFRREGGKSLDSWVDGFDIAFQELRDSAKEQQASEDLHEREIGRARQLHQQWVQKNGMPSNEQQWTAWFKWMKQASLEDDIIRSLYNEIAAPKPQAANAKAAPKAAGKR